MKMDTAGSDHTIPRRNPPMPQPTTRKISSAATAVICGFGPYGYIAGMDAVAQMKKQG
jgi:hypothetical protein